MEKYTVQINKDNYFTVDSKIIESRGQIVRVVNLRSISGVIGEKFDLSDSKLFDIIRNYLRLLNNIELINIYSRKFNKFNLFEIYDNSIIPENSLQNEHSPYGECSKSNENYKLSDYIKFSNEIDESKIKSDLKDKTNHIIPSKLYENLNPQIPKFKKIDLNSCGFIPLWYINGSQKSRAEFTELYTTFEILIHILSKRFITFKAELLALTSTEIQYAKIKGYTVEDYSSFEKDHLASLVLQKDKEIIDLNRKIDNLMLEMRDQSTKIDNQTEEIKSLNQSNLGLKQEVNSLNQTIEENNSKIDNLNQTLGKVVTNVKYLASSSIEFQQEVRYRDEKLIKHINTKLPERIITTGSTNEVFILLYSKSLNDKIHQVREDLSVDEIIIDSISCQNEIVDQELKYHNYDKTQDKFVYYKSLQSNSLDINRYIKENNHIFKPIKGYIRKFIINKSNIPKIKEDLDAIVDKSVLPRTDILTTINNNSDSCESIIEKFSQPLNNISEAISDVEIANNNDKEEIKEMIQIMNERIQKIEDNQEKIIHNQELLINLLTSLDPRVKQFQIKLDHFYYDVNIDLDNKQVLYATKRSKDGKFSDFQPLTIDLFNKSTFRDKNFTKDIYPPSKRHINE